MDERERIARELHDTLLQGTEGLMLQLEAAALTLSPDHTAHGLLVRAMDRADDVMTEGRDRVLDLRIGIESHRSLSQSIEAAVEQLRNSADPKPDGHETVYSMIVEGNEREVLPSIRHEVYCVAREALLNATRHAGARTVEAKARFSDNALRVIVSDDGIGIDEPLAEARARQGHWGLAGMRERAARMGAEFEIVSSPTAGTRVLITVPGRTAYRRGERNAWQSLRDKLRGWTDSTH